MSNPIDPLRRILNGNADGPVPPPPPYVPQPITAPAPVPPPKMARARPRYRQDEDGAARLFFDPDAPADAPPKVRRLANFRAQITEEIRRDDGHEIQRVLTLKGGQESRTFPAVQIGMDEFIGMKWPMKYWGASCIIEPERGAPDHLRTAIQELSYHSGTITSRTIFAHTGWRKINGTWLYLSAGGAIGPKGQIPDTETDLGELNLYALPAPSPTPAARREAALASLRAAQCAPPAVSVPLVAAVFLAPLSEALRPDFMLWLAGPSRSRKSTFSALLSAHYGPDIERTRLPANWSDTAASIEHKAFLLKDALMVIDDFAPTATASEKARMETTAQRVIRSIGNRTSRGRQQADMSQRRSLPPRAVVLSTAELNPEGESIGGRLFCIGLRPGAINLERLSASQSDARKGLLARCMADYLRTIAGNYTAHMDALPNQWRHYRDRAMEHGLDGRLQEQVAYLFMGYEAALSHWLQSEAMSPAEHSAALLEAWTVLVTLARSQESRIQAEQPAERFVSTLRELLLVGSVHLRPRSGSGPADTDKGRFIGWMDHDRQEALLIPGESLAAVAESLSHKGESLALRPAELWQQCEDRGFILPGGASAPAEPGRKRGRLFRIEGKTARVLVFALAALVPKEDEPEDRPDD